MQTCTESVGKICWLIEHTLSYSLLGLPMSSPFDSSRGIPSCYKVERLQGAHLVECSIPGHSWAGASRSYRSDIICMIGWHIWTSRRSKNCNHTNGPKKVVIARVQDLRSIYVSSLYIGCMHIDSTLGLQIRVLVNSYMHPKVVKLLALVPWKPHRLAEVSISSTYLYLS